MCTLCTRRQFIRAVAEMALTLYLIGAAGALGGSGTKYNLAYTKSPPVPATYIALEQSQAARGAIVSVSPLKILSFPDSICSELPGG